MKLLTNSRLRAARACLRKHHIRYTLGYRKRETDEALYVGSLVHGGLEVWYNRMQVEPGPFAIADALESLPEIADPFIRVRVEELLRGYHLRWKEQPWEILAIEEEFQGPLLNPETGAASRTWLQAGKLDLVVRDEQGRAMLVEHKTSSEDISAGSAYWTRLRMDSQLSTYYDGAAAAGFAVQGVIYDVIGKPRLKPYQVSQRRDTPETPEEFRERFRAHIAENVNKVYARGEVVRLEGELEDHRFDVWQLGRILAESERMGRAPKNPDACMLFGRPCQYLPVCSGEASLDDVTRYERVENVHPELSATEAPRSAA
jgi:PD-(D/E)XK nuclease superfamily